MNTLTGERWGGRVVRPTRGTASKSLQEDRFPVVIRPRRLTLETWEELGRCNPGFARQMASQPRHLEAVARTILRHDETARERFGDAETLVRYLTARLRR